MDARLNTKLYLDRIGYHSETTPTIETLFVLQETHLKNVPFENLDIHNKVEIDFNNSFAKVVMRNRGGFCYELNFLFYQLLKTLGYTVKLISARAFDKNKGYGEEFDHMAILATIGNEEYLTDVGFGEFSFHPIRIELDKKINDPRGAFRIKDFGNEYLLVENDSGAGFIPQYIFTKKERHPDEFYGMCHYHQTSSQSHFTQKRLCSLPTDGGRITLTGHRLKITTNGNTVEREVETESGIEEVLWNYFKIRIAKS